MTSEKTHDEIFRKGSKTYFNSSLFFPRSVRRDVFALYAFVRVADDFVDRIPQDREGFFRFVDQYRAASAGAPCGNPVIDGFVSLKKARNFEDVWIDAFLNAMRLDLEKSVYENQEEILKYMYGSAEVIGLFLARIMDLPRTADRSAMMLGRAMQYINFIRDINEDLALGRRYLPLADDVPFAGLNEAQTRLYPQEFREYIRNEIRRYRTWQAEAETGYGYIPHSMLVPVRTAADMYRWTADRIFRDPFVIYRRKIKPSRLRIFARIIANYLM